MSKPEDELEFINVVDHDTGSSFSGRATGSGGGGGEGGSINNGGFVGGHLGFIRQSRNPMTAFFHYVFKFLALFIYVMGGWVSSYTIMTYILCILFLVFDFWTVKNISGRLMVSVLVCLCLRRFVKLVAAGLLYFLSCTIGEAMLLGYIIVD